MARTIQHKLLEAERFKLRTVLTQHSDYSDVLTPSQQVNTPEHQTEVREKCAVLEVW